MSAPVASRLPGLAVSAAGALAVEVRSSTDTLVLCGDVARLGLSQVEASGRMSRFQDQIAPGDRRGLEALTRPGPCDVRLRLVGDDHDVRFIRLIGEGDGDHWQGLIVPAGGAARGGLAQLDLEDRLAEALQDGAILAYHQPVIDFATGRLAGFEALARWDRPGIGVLGPDDFLPLAQAQGFLPAVGDVVRTSAAQDLSAWRTARPDLDVLFVAVNATAGELGAPGFADRLIALTQTAALPRGAYKLEINETEVMHDPEASERVLKTLKAAGVPLVLDDFGTGYSSLARLDQFPFDVVKIDQYFVRAAQSDGSARAIISSVVRIAETYGMSVVAEGVESEAAETLCRDLGCDFGQGFRYARALSPQEAALAVTHGIDGCFGPAL